MLALGAFLLGFLISHCSSHSVIYIVLGIKVARSLMSTSRFRPNLGFLKALQDVNGQPSMKYRCLA